MEIRFAKIFSPYPVGDTNVYIINHEIVVDAGINLPESINDLKNELEKSDMDFENSTLILTHPHVDHFGSAYMFKKVYAHEIACERVHDAEKSYFELIYHHFGEEGMPLEVSRKMKENALKEYSKLIRPCKNCSKVGKKIRAGDDEFEVIHIPGHSFSHIALYNEEHGVLFSGDTLLNGITPNPVIEPDGRYNRKPVLQHYLRTLGYLYGLEIEKVFPGHRKHIENHRKLISDYLDGFERRSIEIFKLCKGKTAYEIAVEHFREKDQLFLAMSEVIAHLDFLHDNGFVEKTDGAYTARGEVRELEELWKEVKAEILQ
ncbi:MBL fold metallo-hydrolase [Geoglobus acetivorans]|uniref:Metallo-beta-lactamase domain-containing protein n=1 Tax=Geoglobus acetivorans TaxID=565033 RepID=A0A0A7GC38_GEOAI|nr:hypothetical protein GACE_0321 [Geoglobus acetivorans]